MAELRLACDAMLGALARWLRFAGFDTLFGPATMRAHLAQVCREEGRWLLTRDRRLASAAGPRVLLLEASDLAGQVAEIRSRIPLGCDPKRAFSRCSRCNGELAAIGRDTVSDRVPPYVATHAVHFVECQGCGRIYWPGTHTGRIAGRLAELFPDPPDQANPAR